MSKSRLSSRQAVDTSLARTRLRYVRGLSCGIHVPRSLNALVLKGGVGCCKLDVVLVILVLAYPLRRPLDFIRRTDGVGRLKYASYFICSSTARPVVAVGVPRHVTPFHWHLVQALLSMPWPLAKSHVMMPSRVLSMASSDGMVLARIMALRHSSHAAPFLRQALLGGR
jgi:hypothetical protein